MGATDHPRAGFPAHRPQLWMIEVTDIKRFLGAIDRAVVWTAGGRFASSAGGIVTVGFVVLTLNSTEQGMFFAFLSMIAAQSLVELGFSTVAIQRISQAHADVRTANSTEERALQQGRLSDFVRWVTRWYVMIAVVLLIILGPLGLVMLSRGDGLTSEEWMPQWLGLALATAIWLAVMGRTVAIEGLGQVREVSKSRAAGSMARALVIIGALVLGGGLWAPAVATIVSAATMYLFTDFTIARAVMMKSSVYRNSISFWRDIWPFQWKISLSWASGFFIFNYMTLALVAERGLIEAGQFGIANSAAGGISALASSVISPKQAVWADWARRKEFSVMDQSLFSTVLVACLAAAVMSAIFFITLLFLMKWLPSLGSRFPSNATVLMLLGAAIVNQVVFSLATYLRAHGSEPYLISSLVFGLCMLVFAHPAAASGIEAVVGLYFAMTIIIGLIWGGIIFYRFRRSRHD